MSESIFVVRHGRFDTMTGKLTDKGREDAEKARDILLERGLGSNSLVLSSVMVRAMQTAEVIAEGLEARVATSNRVTYGGSHTLGIKSFETFLTKALVEADTKRETDDVPLVVVTHAPLVALAAGMYDRDAAGSVGYGQVVEYTPGTWQNPGYIDAFDEMMDMDILNGKISI